MTLHFRSTRPPAGLDRYRPSLTQALSLEDCLRALKTICLASRTATGGRPHGTCISDHTEHGLVSTVRSALTHAAVDPADVRVALPDLPRHAANAARARSHAAPSEHASRARRALRLLTGIEPGSTKLDAPHQFMSDGFLLLQTFATRRQDRSKIVVLARTCAGLSAFSAPANLPSVEELLAFAETDDCSYQANSVRNAVSTYRRLRGIAIRSDAANHTRFAPLDLRLNPRSRIGPSLRRVEAQSVDASGDSLSTIADRVRRSYPKIAQELDIYRASGASTKVTEAWRVAVRSAITRTVSLLDHLYDDATVTAHLPARDAIRLWHLYATDVPLAGEHVAATLDAFLAGVGATKGARGPLLQRLVLDDAPRARCASAFAGDDPMTATWIPQVCARNECALWSVVTAIYAERLVLTDWGAQVMRRTSIMKWLFENGAGSQERAGREMDKAWLVTHLSLPLIVCAGLPWMASTVRVLRAEWQRLRDAHAPEDVCLEAYRAYAFALHDYSAVAIACDDGMRRKNYVNAIFGTHVFATYDGGALVSVELRFGTDRRDPACLKIVERGRRGRRQRVQPHVHTISAGGVDLELLDLWFREVSSGFSYQRPAIMPALGPTASALHGLRMFPSGPRIERNARLGGGFATRVHEAMYSIIRHLHGDAVPPTRTDLSAPQRAACTLHRLRLLLATYWGGVRSDWEYAEHLTTDLRSTLEQHYLGELASEVRDQLQRWTSDWRNPHYLDDLMDAIRAGQAVDVTADRRVIEMIEVRGGWPTHIQTSRRDRRWRRTRERRGA